MSSVLQINRSAKGVATITLNRPEIHNAFDETMIDELNTSFKVLDEDTTVRVIVLTATGRHFCAGADIAWMRRAASQDERSNLEDARRFAQMMTAIQTCSKPVVACIQGSAFGGGVGLICAADIAIASTKAQFCVSEAKLGLLPAVIGPYLIQAIGKRQALRLALTASAINAQEALALGLINQIVEPDDLNQAVDKVVAELLNNGPMALAETKQLFGQLSTAPINEQTRELTARTISRVRASSEARMGLEAFLQKRRPAWQEQAETSA